MFDYVVVGAGSAGCVLANRLTADGTTTVALLEAGGSDLKAEVYIPAAFSKLFRTDVDWAYQTAPQAELYGRSIYWPRGKMLGGSSSMNAQIYIRGHRLDYDGWAALGNEGWGYDDVLPFFKRSEDNSRGASRDHGVGGPLSVSDVRTPNPIVAAILDAAVAAGIPRATDLNDGAPNGVAFNQVTQRRGLRASAAAAFLRPVMRRKNLTVITGALSTRVLLESGRAVGVEYLDPRGKLLTIRAEREVVLAGGAINSPQLLLLSGIGPADALRRLGIYVRHDLPGVGANLIDHPAVGVITQSKKPISLLTAESLPNMASLVARGRGPLTSNVGEACAFVKSRADLPAPDVQFHFAPVEYDLRLEHEPAQHAYTMGPVLVAPKSVGSLRLQSTDPRVAPYIDPAYLTDAGGEDLAALTSSLELARAIGRGAALDAFRGDELLPGADARTDADLEAYVRRYTSTLYHPVGTCKMGSDEAAVVDDRLRVRGVRGLRVVDASIMPTIPRGNTNAPTIMIAERAATFLLGA